MKAPRHLGPKVASLCGLFQFFGGFLGAFSPTPVLSRRAASASKLWQYADGASRLKALKVRKGKQLFSSPKARAVFKALPTDLADPGLTALFEQVPKAVADGKRSLKSFLDTMRKYVNKQLDLAKLADLEYAGQWSCPTRKVARLRSTRCRSDGSDSF